MERPIHTNDFWDSASVQFNDSKEDVWTLLESQIDATEVRPTKVVSLKPLLAIACGFILLIGTGIFAKFYSSTITNSSSTALVQTLPDGSTVELAVNATMNYKPFWWYLNREINFEGIAFFQVEKGSDFIVNSKNGSTQVLGTSFTINSKDNLYNVSCKTGKVRVYSKPHEKHFILSPGQSVVCTLDNCIEKDMNKTENTANEIIYLKNVEGIELFSKIEQIYGISIENKEALKKSISFTGKLNPSRTVEETNQILEAALDISIEKVDDSTYSVNPKN
jgi:hypothetical protein